MLIEVTRVAKSMEPTIDDVIAHADSILMKEKREEELEHRRKRDLLDEMLIAANETYAYDQSKNPDPTKPCEPIIITDDPNHPENKKRFSKNWWLKYNMPKPENEDDYLPQEWIDERNKKKREKEEEEAK